MEKDTIGWYRLDGVIGTGGMGEVYRAHDTSQDRVVALKLLATDLAANEEFRERFRREARLTARLREPHVIPIHRFGEIDGRLYLDMRLVEGESLRRLLDRRQRLSPALAVTIISQLAQALDAAHADGLIHRDVKPTNVLLTGQEDDSAGVFVYLIDFGIARPVIRGSDPTLTQAGDNPGTYAYMAPERFDGSGNVGKSVDIYSLACVLFECLTGKRPFDRDDAPSVIYAQLHDQVPSVGSAFDAVIARGMAKDPANRFTSAGDLAWAARQALATITTPTAPTAPVIQSAPAVQTTPPAAEEKRPAPVSKRQWLLGAAVAVVLVAAVVAGLLLWWPKDKLSGTAQAGPTTPGASTTPLVANRPDDVQQLISRLPTGFASTNCHPGADPEAPGALAVLVCTNGPAGGPETATFASYRDGVDLTAAFEAYGQRHRILPATIDDCDKGVTGRSNWTSDGKVGGQMLCYRDGHGAHVVWTDLKLNTLFIAHKADGNAAKLNDWWRST
ncbi:serine/threonine-protein kinase [Labedaea rhizosphaerae]|uniref:non-specific serine/threonine protein kinase n=1 Tax=Labedaea rhizosphaerae TaxID=598644 RepID=A0A4R6SBW0_LABRH|nr:serine/threonine-protein kinase [Labedaea rhizosphaerae]TDP96506.1 serine/threonine protein kinase [Labedaea rhizosphaerae]